MILLKQGSVNIVDIFQSFQSYPFSANMLKIVTLNPIVFAKLIGIKKIQICLADNVYLNNPTILSTGDSWSSFKDINIAISDSYNDLTNGVIITYFDSKKSKLIYSKKIDQ